MGKIEKLIDHDIKEGDLIKLIDGSALTDEKGNKLYIVHPYTKLTKNKEPLENIEFIVHEIGVKDIICDDFLPLREGNLYYAQDIIVTNGFCFLRTASRLVKKI